MVIRGRWENVRVITVITEPAPEKPGVRLGIGKEEVTTVQFIPPDSIDSIRLEARGRYQADFRSEDGLHGMFSFIPEHPVTCKLGKEKIGEVSRKVMRCRWNDERF